VTVRKVRVLIADDEPVMREALAELLIDSGFDVVGEAPDGSVALELAVALRPDVVLMDMRMPNMDGLEATAAIKGQCPDVRVLILTAYEDESLKRRAAGAGADGYLVKGTLAREILAMVGAEATV
jgi:DNA-binding NarL/FixJ family response regulator